MKKGHIEYLLIFGVIPLLFFSYWVVKTITPYPYLYVALLLVLYGFFVALLSQKESIKLAAIYIGSVVVAFGLAEAYYINLFKEGDSSTNLHAKKTIIYGNPIQGHSILGYVPSKNSKLRIEKFFKDSLLYTYTQTFNEHGWRTQNDSINIESNNAALFFGCSYTFGEGVENNETASFLFQKAAQNEYRSLNFGVEGYGPHQTLAILENELEKEALENHDPKIAIYQMIPDHIFRLKGISGWDYFGPKYKLVNNTDVYYKGPFNSNFVGKSKVLLNKSYLFKSLTLAKRTYDSADIKLLGNVIKKSATLFETRYNGDFYVILWEERAGEKDLYHQIYKQLTDLDIKVIEIKNILPMFYPNSPTYIIQKDFHPNKNAHNLVAQYLADSLINNPLR